MGVTGKGYLLFVSTSTLISNYRVKILRLATETIVRLRNNSELKINGLGKKKD